MVVILWLGVIQGVSCDCPPEIVGVQIPLLLAQFTNVANIMGFELLLFIQGTSQKKHPVLRLVVKLRIGVILWMDILLEPDIILRLGKY